MSFQPGAMVNTQGFGNRPENVEVPHLDVRAPSPQDKNFPVGKRWIDTVAGNEYVLGNFTTSLGVTTANWAFLGGTSGDLNTLTTDDLTVVSPTSGNIDVNGDGIITTAGSNGPGIVTINLTGIVPVANGGTGIADITAHNLIIGNDTSDVVLLPPSATAGIAVVSAGAAADPVYGTVVVAGGGTGATSLTDHGVLVGGGTGAIDALAVGATGETLMGVTANDPAWTASPSYGGSVTAATTITATLGAITATNGNLVLGTAGNKVIIEDGANASVGVSGVMAGSPGAVTVATTACSATALIYYARATTGGTPGHVSITAQDATGFTLTSTADETSTFNWWIINA